MKEFNMTYSIIGSGSVGTALARQFARSGITVGVANTRGPASLASMAKELGDKVEPLTLQDALNADVIFLAIPFWSHRDIAKARSTWQGKIVIDVTNAYGVPLSELDNLPSSAIVAKSFPGAHLVKAFNHLPAQVLALDPAINGGRRVIFLSGDDNSAVESVDALVQQLGFAPISLGKIAEGGQLVQAQDKSWAPLIFQDLFKRISDHV
ncbi:MAG: NADPH-dependent F420 reductase [Rhodanobacter sp.]